MSNNMHTTQERTDIIEAFIQGCKNARRVMEVYRRRYPDRLVQHVTTMYRVYKRFQASGSTNGPPCCPRRSHTRVTDMKLDVLLYAQEHPTTSLWQTGRVLGISKDSFRHILYMYNISPFRAHIVHGLHHGDHGGRVQFLALLCFIFYNNPDAQRRILWTDEARFTNNSMINLWNYEYWAEENSHITYSILFYVVYSINVWCGLLDNMLIGLYFYHENLNSERYLEFLETTVPDLFRDVPLHKSQDLYYQQDGCPGHTERAIQYQLNVSYPNWWIGTQGSIPWPPRSPDLTPLDYYLWSYLKNRVYGGYTTQVA
ncbi:UNVERIFIED_CONTAM: hypothetical protein RMT77_010067 [Armadillidium vulgare]